MCPRLPAQSNRVDVDSDFHCELKNTGETMDKREVLEILNRVYDPDQVSIVSSRLSRRSMTQPQSKPKRR